MTASTKRYEETHYFLESKKNLDNLNKAIVYMEDSKDFSLWTALADTLGSILGLLGVILSETKETKTTVQNGNGHKEKDKSIGEKVFAYVMENIVPPVLVGIIIAQFLK